MRKGIALTPVKFGIAFTLKQLNQAGALVHVFTDGSVQVNHGGTEMGQGLYIKVAQVVAEEFGIGIDRVRITATRTDKVPNTAPTAASSGSDLNGMAARRAARTIRRRLAGLAARLFQVRETDVAFRGGMVRVGSQDDSVRAAHAARVHRAGVALVHRLLRDPQDHLGPRHRERAPLPLLRRGRRVQRGDGRHRDRRDARRPGGHPPRLPAAR